MLFRSDRSRFRLNAFKDKRANAVVVRRVSTNIPKFKDLNLPAETFERISSFDDGMVILAGVTGSGKSTTIAAMIDHLNETDARHIITIEDPIEYEFLNKKSFISQREIGVDCLNFKAAIRTLVRQDPDVVLIGEMRDLETAEAAIQASLTGHLVFSTLHTNDAPSAFTRLIDMGIEPFLVGSTVEGVMAQRLVRTICPDCKTEFTPEHHEVPGDFPGAAAGGVKVSKGTGCRSCRQTGFRGRTGIYELMVTGDNIRELCVQRVSAVVIRNQALKEGMITLRQDGWRKVQRGNTTLDEVARVTAGDIIG